jgi:hypothetical protein
MQSAMYGHVRGDRVRGPTDVKDAEGTQAQLTVVGDMYIQVPREQERDPDTRPAPATKLQLYQQGQGAEEKTPSETRSGIHGW